MAEKGNFVTLQWLTSVGTGRTVRASLRRQLSKGDRGEKACLSAVMPSPDQRGRTCGVTKDSRTTLRWRHRQIGSKIVGFDFCQIQRIMNNDLFLVRLL